ncbi:MAG TPA: HAD-IA family hydrolase [Pirellulales bacterium]|jgi:putative hydrolase of the HAD superfamily
MRPAFIYFDIGNVICFFDRAREVRQVAEVSGVPEDKIREVLLAAETGLLWKLERGQFSEQQFYEAFCQATGSRPAMEKLLTADADIFTLNGSLLPLIAQLEDSRIPLGVLSNISAPHWRLLTDGRYAILPGPFRERILSFEAGAQKPDDKIFRRAIERARVPADQIFYADDVLGHVEAAKKLGIDAVQYTTTDALEQDLLARGIRCNF